MCYHVEITKRGKCNTLFNSDSDGIAVAIDGQRVWKDQKTGAENDKCYAAEDEATRRGGALAIEGLQDTKKFDHKRPETVDRCAIYMQKGMQEETRGLRRNGKLGCCARQ
ncbi:uncharacterized protein LOC116853268 [Odontomachus brunneus]|uniref:uncharacterized protein LOC116853268 n=1 Tax=Odontomachus brunneus TaxID=486640 RepID=UPI0013F23FB8|nr:uncharacterized protein LOC116853268 [Odontomachus brunneus]